MTTSHHSHVFVGMSGGVDSSVSAFLLQEQGYQVTGLFMKNWEEDDTDTYCSASQDLADAQAVSDRLAIELKTVNFATEYWDHVFEYFLQEYSNGRTPNPDILCNREIKFKAFLNYATALGADFIATGHYAQNQLLDGYYQLQKGTDSTKDQTYFLYTLQQSQLAKSLFPVGQISKTKVRAIAKQLGLTNHAKKDSTGICFIGERKFKDFLSRYLPTQPGDILTTDGKIIGQHDGLMYYTIGQRKGLQIGGRSDYSENPWYVVAKILDRNQLIVAQGHDHPALFAKTLFCQQLSWVSGVAPCVPLHCTAKTRYRQQDQSCVVTLTSNGDYQVTFTEPQRAITLGQSVVFYENNICLGGGIISAVIV